MAAASARTKQGRARPPDGQPAVRNFYEQALTEAERVELPVAHDVEGLDDEIAMLRVRLKSVLKERPQDLQLIAKGLDMLVKAVAARYRLSPQAKRDLADNLAGVITSLGGLLYPEAETRRGDGDGR